MEIAEYVKSQYGMNVWIYLKQLIIIKTLSRTKSLLFSRVNLQRNQGYKTISLQQENQWDKIVHSWLEGKETAEIA